MKLGGNIAQPSAGGFRHEAFFYRGEHDFVGGIAAFILDGLSAGEPILVAVRARKVERLRGALGPAAGAVQFIDMEGIGGNPGRIIPLWQQFVARHATGRSARGVGEPIWAGRGPEELVEAQIHEALLNPAFEGRCNLWLVCPYDLASLEPAVIDEARRSHPELLDSGGHAQSTEYRPFDAGFAFSSPLAESPPEATTFSWPDSNLGSVQAGLGRLAAATGLSRGQTDDLLVAIAALLESSRRHGGPEVDVRLWKEAGGVVCEVRDRGRISHPLLGREVPRSPDEPGYGLWLAHQVCDLVQLRARRDGTTVRLHMVA